MIINTNISANNAYRNLSNTNAVYARDLEKASSGLRIARASDDASGLAVSEKMRAQISGLQQAQRNIELGASFMQTAGSYLDNISSALLRLRELSVQMANGIYSDADRAQVQVEVKQLVAEVGRVSSQAEFNGLKMLDGSFAEGGARDGVLLQIGANAGQNRKMYISDMSSSALGLGEPGSPTISLSTQEGANQAIEIIDTALDTLNRGRADIGGYQYSMEMAARGQAVAAENLQAAESLIRDADMASVVVDLARDQILSTVGTAMLAQANQRAQIVQRLFS